MSGIVVGVDGSKHSRHALEWAVHEAAVRHEPLTVLTVQSAIIGDWGSPIPYPRDPEFMEAALDLAKEEADSVLGATAEADRPPSVTVKAYTGIPAEELLSAANDADLLVVGSRGAGGFKRLLLGSVSSHVTHHAHCPVVVIPDDQA